MASVIYDLDSKGVRLIPSSRAWVVGKNGRSRLNPNYNFVGKVEMSMPNMVVTASDKLKPTFKGDVSSFNKPVKRQIIEHFYYKNGKRNGKTVAYFGVPKKNMNPIYPPANIPSLSSSNSIKNYKVYKGKKNYSYDGRKIDRVRSINKDIIGSK